LALRAAAEQDLSLQLGGEVRVWELRLLPPPAATW